MKNIEIVTIVGDFAIAKVTALFGVGFLVYMRTNGDTYEKMPTPCDWFCSQESAAKWISSQSESK